VDEPTYRVSTLGCRVNLADSLAMERSLSSLGYRRASPGEVPGVWVVNTCAVTGEGMRKSRKLVRKCASGGSTVIVTGCGVDFDPDSLKAPGVAALLPNRRKERFPETIGRLMDRGHEVFTVEPWTTGGLVRVPVKVQDGCDRRCAYCIVPFLRPPNTSRPAGEIADEVGMLTGLGAGEVVLCGIDLGSYREPDTDGGIDSLVMSVLEACGTARIRLSSIEVTDVGDGLAGLMSSHGALCRHLHIPLQSGDARTLSRMGREYGPEEFEDAVRRLEDLIPGLAVTTDVMVGFPGEDEGAFLNTARLVRELGFHRVHVFKYSRRPGTAAFALEDDVPARVKEARAASMRDIAASNAARFHRRFVGRIIPVLVEAVMEVGAGRLFGRAESFSGAYLEGPEDLVGKTVEVTVRSAGREGLFCEIAGKGRVLPGGGR
jgi:threonylcarbamoyladenosine tRNA methylthiotransferase MtaB